jgi:cellulose synthase/poly-beta-1,6-N-acetylglucosamine synthase-like glycosyltransferase
VAVRHAVLEKLGGFREDVRFFGDMELSWRMQLAAGAGILFRPEAVIHHRHRRTWGELWRQACQHGRGVAFLKKAYPDHYRIRAGEQIGRIGGLFLALWQAIMPMPRRSGPQRAEARSPNPERLRAPLFLSIWYAGLLAGYLLGPARSQPAAPAEKQGMRGQNGG